MLESSFVLTLLILLCSLLSTPEIIAHSILASTQPEVEQYESKGPIVDSVRFIRYSDQNVALEQVKQGKISIYYFAIPLEVVSEMRNDPTVKIYDRTAGSFGLLFNPAPSNKTNGVLNPFQSREIRYAMNFLVNREFVVDEILKGYGSVLIDPFGQYSPEYPNLIDTVESLGISYNPEFGRQIVDNALLKAGAVKDQASGKWLFAGKPVTVKILIRSDDPRRKSLGDLVSTELDKIGLTVVKLYGDLNKANTVVSGSNPQDFQWHVYTEGYAGTSAFVKYNPVITSQMYAPYAGNMPGGQNPAFWNYQNFTIDEVTQRINFFNFTSEQQRNELLRNATKAGIQESVRIFIAQNTDPYVADADVDGLINDFGAGITSKLSLINARPPDLSMLNVGVKEIYEGAWNSVGGCSDTYCTSIYSALADSATFRNPYTGEVIPFRNNWTDIITSGPSERMKVASDALLWDPYSQHWKKADNNTFALSKVNLKLLYSKWHHGIPMDRADILYPIYFAFEWGTDQGKGDLTVDPEYTAAVKESLPLAKGIRFINDSNVESFVDQWHYDKKEIADSAAAWAAQPWEITAATERLVMAGKVAYSRAEATVKNVPWLSLIVPGHARMILAELQKMKSESFVPIPLKGIVPPKEAVKRYDAAINWIQKHGHAVISNGPFYLDSYDPGAGIIIIKAFRDPSYPFPQGYWSVFENPKLAVIQSIGLQKYLVAGEPLHTSLNITVGGKPSNDALVNYLLSDAEGKVILRGHAEPIVNKTQGLSLSKDSIKTDTVVNQSSNVNMDTMHKQGEYAINLDSNDTLKLQRGPNLMKIFATTADAYRPDIYTLPLMVVNK